MPPCLARRLRWFATLVVVLLTSSGGQPPVFGQEDTSSSQPSATKEQPPMDQLAQATFGGGCFWCTEAVFLELEGVHRVVSGYSGGFVENPTYEQVCTGQTGHAEVVQIDYDPNKVQFEELLEVFFRTHDPTTLNRQGADVGTQYRSVVFYDDQQQQETTQQIIQQLNASGAFRSPIVTQVDEFEKFYPAEDYHQNYFAENRRAPYCRAVIQPKLNKFRKVFKDKLKKPEESTP